MAFLNVIPISSVVSISSGFRHLARPNQRSTRVSLLAGEAHERQVALLGTFFDPNQRKWRTLGEYCSQACCKSTWPYEEEAGEVSVSPWWLLGGRKGFLCPFRPYSYLALFYSLFPFALSLALLDCAEVLPLPVQVCLLSCELLTQAFVYQINTFFFIRKNQKEKKPPLFNYFPYTHYWFAIIVDLSIPFYLFLTYKLINFLDSNK